MIVLMMTLKAINSAFLAQFIISSATIFAHYFPILKALFFMWDDFKEKDTKNHARMFIYIELMQFTVNTFCVAVFTIYAYFVKYRTFQRAPFDLEENSQNRLNYYRSKNSDDFLRYIKAPCLMITYQFQSLIMIILMEIFINVMKKDFELNWQMHYVFSMLMVFRVFMISMHSSIIYHKGPKKITGVTKFLFLYG